LAPPPGSKGPRTQPPGRARLCAPLPAALPRAYHVPDSLTESLRLASELSNLALAAWMDAPSQGRTVTGRDAQTCRELLFVLNGASWARS